MSYVIALAGKGGVGKTTISALLIRFLANIDPPILAIDADPNSNLDLLLGIDYADTVSDIREETRNLSSLNLSKGEFFNMKLEEIIAEGDKIDLLVMGRPEGPGCYCAVNNILREYLQKINKRYKFVVIDNEAGMEHLSRRTAGAIDKLLLVSDSTMVGLYSSINAFTAAKKAGLLVKSASLLINKSRSELGEQKLGLLKKSGIHIASYMPFIEQIEKDSEEGKPLPDTDIKALDIILKDILGSAKVA